MRGLDIGAPGWAGVGLYRGAKWGYQHHAALVDKVRGRLRLFQPALLTSSTPSACQNRFYLLIRSLYSGNNADLACSIECRVRVALYRVSVYNAIFGWFGTIDIVPQICPDRTDSTLFPVLASACFNLPSCHVGVTVHHRSQALLGGTAEAKECEVVARLALQSCF